MRDEPESEMGFDRGMLWMNDRPHEEFGTAQHGRIEELPSQPGSGALRGGGEARCVCCDRIDAKSAALPVVEERAERDRAAIPGQDHRLEPSSDHPAHSAVSDD